MKKSLQITALLLLIFAQSWSQQMNHWYLSPKQIDMTAPTPSVTPITQIFGNAAAVAAGQVGNGFYDAAGNLLFYIADASVYDYNNTLLGNIENGSTEVSIVPFGDNNNCQRKFNIFSVKGGFNGLTCLFQAVLDMNGLSLTSTQIDCISSPVMPGQTISEFGALAVSKTNSNNERYLYFLAGPGTVGSTFGQINLLTIQQNGTVTTNGKIYPTTLNPNTNAGGEVFAQELDLSPDGKWLAWASFADVNNAAGTQYRYHFLELDATGNYINNSIKRFNLPSNYTGNNTQGFRGVEFYQSGTNTTLFFGAGTDGIFYTDLPGASSFKPVGNSFGTSGTSFGFSQIEMAKNNYMYASSALASVNIGAFLPSSLSPQILMNPNSFTLSSPLPPKATWGGIFYTLPDQIDGQDYSTIVPTATTSLLTDNSYTFGTTSTQTATWSYTGTNPWNTTSEDIHIIKELRIKNSSNLTIIGMTFKFSPDAKVVIEQGSTLTLDGTTFTGNYVAEPCFIAYSWLGVEVWGVSTANQNSTQGKLVMKNYAQIEYAQCGVRAYNFTSNTINLNTTGGIIKANALSTFKDNNVDVDFKTYTKNMSSSFYDCIFKTTDNYPFSTAPIHATIENCGSVTFSNCEFTQNSLPAVNMQSIGIKTVDASFTLINNCKFVQLWFGINATRITSNKSFASYQSLFADNYTGILINSINGVVLKQNLFEIGGNANQTINVGIHTGVILQNSSGFTIEENEFKISNNPLSGISKRGINISNSGPADNEIYKNTFSNLDYGNIALNINRDNTAPAVHGLQYFCNQNTANITRDFQVGSPSNAANGIRLTQGSSLMPAGNTFSHFGGIGSNTDINNNTLQPIDYYYNNSSSLQVPWYYYNAITHVTANANLCPSHNDNSEPLMLTAAKTQLLTNGYDNAEATYQNLNSVYNLLMDGGDKNDLLNAIQQSWPADAMQLRDELLSKSPYLSQEVLREAAQKNILPQAMLLAICMANPDATKDETFLDYLHDEIPNPLPQYMIDMQKASWDVNTVRTTMQSIMGYYNNEMAIASNKILADLYFKRDFEIDSTTAIDTTNYNANIRYWLHRVNTLTSKYDLIENYLNENNLSQAQSILDSLPFNFKMSDDQFQAYNDYVYFFNFRKNCLINGIALSNLNETQINDLEIFASGNDNLAKSLAQNLLCYFYNKCIELDNEITSSGNRLINKSTVIFEKINNAVTVSPNPAAQYTVFTYNLPLLKNKAVLVICDLTGKVIEQMSLNAKEGQQLWDTRNVQNGLYYYIVKDGVDKIAKGKVAVEH